MIIIDHVARSQLGNLRIYPWISSLILLLVAVTSAPATDAPRSEATDNKSQFAKEINRGKYRDAPEPSAAPIFRWDFSKANVVHSYAYEQEGRNLIDAGPPYKKPNVEQIFTQNLFSTGNLLVKSMGNGTADLVLKDVNIRSELKKPGDNNPVITRLKLPPSVIHGIKSEGSGLSVTGYSRITLKRYVKIGKRTCAQLNITTNISDLRVPTERKEQYRSSAIGTSVVYLDVARLVIVSSVIAMLIRAKVEVPASRMRTNTKHELRPPRRTYTEWTIDDFIKVKLKN